MHYLTLVTAPATYPVTLAELKSHLAIDVATEDTRLTSLIAAATDLCEIFTGRSFVTQTWKLTMPSFPYANNELFLPKPPLQSVTFVKYYDADTNVQNTWSNTNYYTVTPTKAQGWIEPISSNPVYPATYCRPDAVQVTFVCGGYGLNQVSQAIKLICAHWNEAREGDLDIPVSAQRLLAQLSTGAYK